MSKLFDFLKSASKSIDNIENAVDKFSKAAKDFVDGATQSAIGGHSGPKSYADLMDQYGNEIQSAGPGKEFSFDAYMYRPAFCVTYHMPDDTHYIEDPYFEDGELYCGFSYENDKTANFIFAFDFGASDVTEDALQKRFSGFYGPVTVLKYQKLLDSHFDIRMEMANEKIHTILYERGEKSGNWFFAQCEIYRNNVDERTAVKIMKDFEDMVAGIQYSDKLLNPTLVED